MNSSPDGVRLSPGTGIMEVCEKQDAIISINLASVKANSSDNNRHKTSSLKESQKPFLGLLQANIPTRRIVVNSLVPFGCFKLVSRNQISTCIVVYIHLRQCPSPALSSKYTTSGPPPSSQAYLSYPHGAARCLSRPRLFSDVQPCDRF